MTAVFNGGRALSEAEHFFVRIKDSRSTRCESFAAGISGHKIALIEYWMYVELRLVPDGLKRPADHNLAIGSWNLQQPQPLAPSNIWIASTAGPMGV
jgi:hypothetical protein